jgi:UDP-glucose 4-epimerase
LETQRARFNLVYADLTNALETVHAVQAAAPQVIFHLAAGGVEDPFLGVDVALAQNLNGTLNLLQAAFEGKESQKRPEQMIVVRTPGEDSAMNPYAASKAAAWSFCRMYARTRGWPIVGAKLFQTYGPGQGPRYLVTGALLAALAGEDFPMTAGAQERDWIYVADAAAGLRAVRDARLAPGTSVDLGSGTLTSVAALVQQVYALVGGKGRPQPGALPTRPGEEPRQVADAKRTQSLIGWQTAVPLSQGLALLHDYLLSEDHLNP